MSQLVEKLTSKISSAQEVLILQQLHSNLTAENNRSDTHISLPGLSGSDASIELFGEGNPYPDATLEVICPTQCDLDKLTCYVFERRFGWSETDTEDGQRVRRLSSTGATMSAGTGKQKTVINSMLDCFLKWFLYQEMNIPLLKSLKYTVKQTVNMPVARNRAVIHTMDWCKSNQEHLCDEIFFTDIQDLVLLSLMDVWSAIRNATVSRLAPVTASLNLHHLRVLFDALVKIFEEDSTWQMKEGAIMGINVILQRFLNRPHSKSPLSSPRTLDIDTEHERRVPEFISDKIHGVVFSLLSHSQLTIREHAAKTLATYITCSSISDALNTLNEVILILRSSSRNTQVNVGLVTLLQASDNQFLDDYAAEGFLGVCIFLVKVIPLSCLLPGWPEYISTFLLYLSHPASTVRQAASSVFKYLVVKSSHSVVILKLLLQALAMGWNPDTECMTVEGSPDDADVGQPSPSVCNYKGSNLSDTWQGREGRLFAYELIFRYLIKNHWLYTFGPAGSGIHMDAGVTNREIETIPEKTEISENGHPAQFSSTPKPMHHVESEKSLAFTRRKNWRQVRFLTQADIKIDGSESWHRLERGMSTDHDADSGGVHMRPSSRSSGRSSTPGSDTVTAGQYDNLCSLLTQARVLDHGLMDSDADTDGKLSKQELQLRRLKILLENNNNKSSTTVCSCGWMEKEYLQDMSRILKVILYQTAESIGHSQWELRRIANQVLPCLAEVIRWYDINILVSMWNSYLNVVMPTCLMTFTSVLLLKESVIHAVKLFPLLHRPPNSWQDHDQCSDYLSAITGTIQRRLAGYLPHLAYLIQRDSCDKLSIISADVILTAYEHFNINTEHKSEHYDIVLSMWLKVFSSAHPQSKISPEILHVSQSKCFVSPFHGYLSCCLVKPDNKIQCAKQVEKHMLSEIHHRLPVFLSNLPVISRYTMSPILAHYVGQLVDDMHISKLVLECLQCSSSVLLEYIETVSDKCDKMYCIKCILNTLTELAAVITMKSIELPQLQKILRVYEELCRPINPSQHLAVLLAGIASRINESVEFSVDQGKLDGDEDLFLMSNDIPTVYSEAEQLHDSDSEEDIHVIGSPGTRFPESLTLNTSNNSGSLTGRLSSLSSHSADGNEGTATPGSQTGDSEGESSDWDSWDEEEESQTAFNDAFSEFLVNLQKLNTEAFHTELKHLPSKQRNVITSLLKT